MTPKKRILIVDDESMLLRSLTMILNSYGYEARGELDASGALEAVQSQTFDLILLDLTLPDISGLELLPQLRTIQPDARVLLFAANIPVDIAQQAKELGARGFIVKPVEPDELIRHLDFYLQE